jgi:glycosyltransferase involved in cell wall biosynthesis
LYFGRLSPEKGVADLVRAMARMPEIRLQIAGDGPERSRLEELASGLGNIEFVGHVNTERLDDLIRKSRFTVFPSRAYETFGKSILESYAHGRAVIASDLGSRRELVQLEVTGLLYPPGDVDQLAQAISFLCERPDVARQMGAAARTLVRLRYSPESHSHELTALYQDLAARTQAHKAARSTKLKVAFIGGRGVGRKYSGIESYYEEVGRNLVSRGHEVTAYSRSYFTPHVNEYDGIRIVLLPTIRSKHLETLLHTLLSTVHVLFADCNIVHYHALGPAMFSFIPPLFGKRTVVTVQGLDWQRKKWNRFASAILRVGELASAQCPNATMVVSRTLQNYYREHYGIDPTYIPNGTSIREKRTPERIVALGLQPGNYILFLGRFSPEKNCDLLIRAFQRIDTPVKLVLAGGSSHTDRYARQLRMHESDPIRLMDYVSGDLLDELLTNAMLFVLPSDLEGMSLALLDAMGAGVCVLASDIPENHELVEGAGFTFRRGDVDDLERMLRLLIFDQHAREAAAHASRERVREEYLWPAITRQIERVYYQVLGCSAEITIRGYD